VAAFNPKSKGLQKAAFLMTDSRTEQCKFHALGSREVVGQFDGGDITTDAGGLLLSEVEQRTAIITGVRC